MIGTKGNGRISDETSVLILFSRPASPSATTFPVHPVFLLNWAEGKVEPNPLSSLPGFKGPVIQEIPQVRSPWQLAEEPAVTGSSPSLQTRSRSPPVSYRSARIVRKHPPQKGRISLFDKVTLGWWGGLFEWDNRMFWRQGFLGFVLYVLKLRPVKCNGPPEVNL